MCKLIDIKIELPKEYETILIQDKSTNQWLQGYMKLFGDNNIWMAYLWNERIAQPTHWIAMPNPPEL